MNAKTPSPIRVYIVEDHPVTRDGLAQALDHQPGMMVCGESGTYAHALNALGVVRPDVLVLDLNLPDGNGWTLIDKLQARGRLPPTLVLSVCDERLYARRLLRAGARGFLMKDAPTERVLSAVRAIHAGQRVMSAAIHDPLIEEALGLGAKRAEPDMSRAGAGALSDRETQIGSLLTAGMSNKDIAVHLGLSEKTVSTHKINLMKKLGVRSAAKLADYYRTFQQSGSGER